MTIPDEGFILGTGSNYSLYTKRVFLSFAQELFALHSKYTWRRDVNTTSIFIADKYALDTKFLEKKPAIILERGGMRWERSSIAQRMDLHLTNMQEDYSDLIRGTVRYNCLAKNGLVAEEIALALLNAVTGFKKQFRKNGIHQILDISVGEETLLKADADIELSVVPVIIVYTTQKKLTSSIDFYSIYVTLTTGDTTAILLENIDYTVRQSTITFTKAPVAGSTVQAIYVDAGTLNEITESPTPATDGITTEFTLSGAVYGYGPLVETFEIISSGVESDSDTWEEATIVSGWFNV